MNFSSFTAVGNVPFSAVRSVSVLQINKEYKNNLESLCLVSRHPDSYRDGTSVVNPRFIIYKRYTYQQVKLTASISNNKNEAGI
jgi:hypothetical protein